MKLIAASLFAAAGLFAAQAMAADTPEVELAKKSNCLTCHQVDKKLVGPAYKDIAKKYKGDAAAPARLFDRVKKGSTATGGEVWKAVTGGMPMPPNAAVKDEDIKKLVAWVLSQ
jgi:cytochrome c